jgi:carbamate kinase
MDSIQPSEVSYKDDYYKRAESLPGSIEPKRQAKVEMVKKVKGRSYFTMK